MDTRPDAGTPSGTRPEVGVEAAIAARGLRVVRGDTLILRDVTLTVPTGLIYGLVGPSGAGKTTLMRAVAGVQRLAGGELRVLGLAAGSPALRGRIGYMPQSPALYTDLTARENLEFFAGVYGLPPGRVEAVLRTVDLAAVSDRPVATYSGGERQRLSLAIALLPEPPLLLLDEPTVGLDPVLRRRMWAQFRVWAAAGATVMVSTHVMDEAARADRLAFLYNGALLAEGSPVEIVAGAGAADLEEAVVRLAESKGEGR
jgi:ABC-2 type transport system ATP-binding protein